MRCTFAALFDILNLLKAQDRVTLLLRAFVIMFDRTIIMAELSTDIYRQRKTGDLFEKKHFDETTNDRADRYGTAAACASYFKRSGTARNQPNRE